MEVESYLWTAADQWDRTPGEQALPAPDLVLVFGQRNALRQTDVLQTLRASWPDALITGCSTAGEIYRNRVLDDSITCLAVSFSSTVVRSVTGKLGEESDSADVGRTLGSCLPPDGLRHVVVFADGLVFNGGELARSLASEVPPGVAVTGGLAADGDRFATTVIISKGHIEERSAVAIGFYSESLEVGYGSLGGWDPFGPERLITRSEGNVLYDLDGRSALSLYREYLGDQAAGLPASALLFPLEVRTSDGVKRVRTILGIDDESGSMTFAGDMPLHGYARFMMANFDRLIDGAAGAAQSARVRVDEAPQLALLVSCVGRKLILRQRIEEEVEGVQEVLGEGASLGGFYSYGEISPLVSTNSCELHNQTMTITTFRER